LNQLGVKAEDNLYLGSRGRKFSIFPTSTLARRMPKWLVTAELMETSRLYATLAGTIQPEWVLDAAAGLLRHEYSEPHWEKNKGQVIAFDKVSLFGLTLIERKRVPYSNIDPVASREIFIREGLAAMQLETRASFYRHNLELLDSIRREEEKLRRPEFILSEDKIHDFFASRIPPGICDTRSLESWARQQKHATGCTGLELSREDLVSDEVARKLQLDFPDAMALNSNRLRIDYLFEPGADLDGAAIDVPLEMLSMLSQSALDWAVPGTLQERCTFLMKSLPKQSRKQFVPLPEYIEAFLLWQKGQASERTGLCVQLREFARITRGVRLEDDVLDTSLLPSHLQPWIRVLDDAGKELARSQSLSDLQKKFAKTAVLHVPEAGRHPLEKDQIKDWNFGTLPLSVISNPGTGAQKYPALIDKVDSVALLLQEDARIAEQLTRQGLCRLLILRSVQQRSMIQSRLKAVSGKLALVALHAPGEILEEGVTLIFRQAFNLDDCAIPHNKDEFDRLLMDGKPRLIATAEKFETLIGRIVDLNFDIQRRLGTVAGKHFEVAVADLRKQLQGLLYPGYLSRTPGPWLQELPRYLQAMQIRLEKLSGQLERDQESQRLVNVLESRWLNVVSRCANGMLPLDDTRWMLEELRISLFAQSLGTRLPVSEKRIIRKLEELERQCR